MTRSPCWTRIPPRSWATASWGELSDMVSQFEVAEEYTQINYKGRPVRVTPLRYGDWIKWFNNRSEGLPAYLIIDMVTQNVEVVRLEQGIRYTTAEHFGRNLYRYLQFHYPTYILTSRPSRSTRTAIPIGSALGSEKNHRTLWRHGHQRGCAGERRHRGASVL